jgi:hypothetical protein
VSVVSYIMAALFTLTVELGSVIVITALATSYEPNISDTSATIFATFPVVNTVLVLFRLS